MTAEQLSTLRQWYSNYVHEWLDKLHVQANVDASQLLLRLLKQIHTCESLTENDFVIWAEQFIAEELADRKWRASMAGLTLAEILTIAKGRKRAACKPMEVEIRGERAFIALYDSKKQLHVWTVATDWLPVAHELWPVTVRHSRAIGWYIAKHSKKQALNGEWVGMYVPVHHILLGANNDRVLARDGNYLNHLPGNLHLENDGREAHVTEPWLIEMQRAKLARASTPLLPSDSYDSKPARATAGVSSTDVFTCPDAAAVRALRAAWGVRA